MRKVYFHIGCGKTGSSALQVWLMNHREKLLDNNIYYPDYGRKKLGDYQISSGNGVVIRNALADGCCHEIIERDLNESKENILYSSEGFQGLSFDEIKDLVAISKSLRFEICIIVYVRDVYDVMYSGYLQLLKRNAYCGDFLKFVKNAKGIQQFSVLDKYEKFFENISVLNYDYEKKYGLEKAFCEVMGIDSHNIGEMSQRKVNRSLTVFEARLFRLLNRQLVKYGENKARIICTRLSDYMIAKEPEKETEIFFDKEAFMYLQKSISSKVDYVNSKYLDGKNLKIFSKSGKNIVCDDPSIDRSIVLFLEGLFSVIMK